MNIRVTKRDKTLEPLDYEKINVVLKFACENLNNVSISDILINSKINFYDKIKTTDIQTSLIKTVCNMIDEEHPDYSIVASRLVMFDLRKQVYKSINPIPLIDVIKNGVKKKLYHSELLDMYSEDEWNKIEQIVDHNIDFDYLITAANVFLDKYLIKDRSTNEYIETPQYAIIMIGAVMNYKYIKKNGKFDLSTLKSWYHDVCKGDILYPTPNMAGVRSSIKQFSSCVTLSCGDSLESINASANTIVKYASKRAGLGVDMGRVRAEGSKIKGGLATTTGIIPFTRYLTAGLKSCSQGGIRGSAGTFNYPIWHREVQDLIVLKNNKGTAENRIRVIDYCFAWNKYLVMRAWNHKPISLFCPNDVTYGKHGNMYDAFYGKDIELFAKIYEAYENDKSIKKVVIEDGFELLCKYAIEYGETGRTYPLFSDNVNYRSQFKDPITTTNLCTEITLRTKPNTSPKQQDGLTSLCILGGVNMMVKLSSLPRLMRHMVRTLDAAIDIQEYEDISAERSTKLYRPLGIGLVNYAYWMAKNDFHNPDNLLIMRDKVHEFMEHMYYYALSASVELAEEYGPCEGYNDLMYSEGKLNIDFRNKALDEIATYKLQLDWDSLRERIKKYGVRNSQLLALMPTETSSQIPGATNGVDLIREYMVEKDCKGYTSKFIAPELHKLRHKYRKPFDMSNIEFCETQLINMAIMQQYVCQGISTNLYLVPNDKGKLQFGDMIRQFLYAMVFGLKTTYYCHIDKDKLAKQIDDDDNMFDQESIIEVEEFSSGCESGSCAL